MDIAALWTAFMDMIASGNLGGAALVLVAIAFFLFWKKFEKIESSLKKKEPHDYNKMIIDDSMVMDDLDVLRQEFNADRAIILELRNGEANLADIPAMKVYVRNERLRPHTFSISNVINGVPASFYSVALKKLVKGETYRLPNIEELKNTDFGLYQNLIQVKVKSLYAVPLIDTRGILYGAIMVEYCNSTKDLSQDEIHDLILSSAKINGELALMKDNQRAL